MERKSQRIVRSPSLKRRSRVIPINQRVQLERVIGLTGNSNATLDCDIHSGTIAYPAGCVVVLLNGKKQSHIINACKKTITAVRFSKDGKNIVTGECGHQPAVRVWDVEEKTQVAEFFGHKFGINCVSFAPNNKYIVSIGSQHDMMVAVWNWKSGIKVASNKISSKVNAVAFSEDGSMFVTVGNRHVKFWYLESSKSKILNETVPLSGRSGILGDLKNNFFSDVVCGKNKTVFCITQSGYLCSFNEKRLLEKWAELKTTCANCVTAAGNNIFVGCANGVVRVFSAEDLHYVANLPHPHYLGVDVASALNPSQMVNQKVDAKYPDTIGIVYDDWNSKVTCIYNDHSMYIWDVHDIKKVGKSRSFLFHSSFIYSLETCPPLTLDSSEQSLPLGSFITCSSDDTIRIWNLDPHMKDIKMYKRNIFSQELLKVLYTDPTLTYLRDVNYNPAGGTDKTDTNYDDKNGVRSLCISPDCQHLASGDRIGNIRIHDLETLEEITTIEAHDQEVLCLQYSNFKNGPKLLATSSRDRMLHIFDVEQNYKLLQTLDDHSSSITAVKFVQTDRQMKMLSCGADKSLLFRNAQLEPDLQFTLDQHLVGKTTLYDMVIDPTEKFAATACQDRNIRIYSIKTSKQRKNYKGTVGDDGVLMKLQLDPSGTYFATSCTVDKSITIIDYATGEIQASMIGHAEYITGIKFTNNLKHLISVSADGCIFVWRLPVEMTNAMQSRLEELGQMYQEASTIDNTSNADGGKVPLVAPTETEFKTPSKILAELNEYNQQKKDPPTAKEPLDYRFSIGQLPKWAKNMFGDEKSKSPEQASVQPKGKWADRSEQRTILAQIDGKRVEIGAKADRNIRKLPLGEDEVDDIPQLRRETMVLPHPTVASRESMEEIEDGDVIYLPNDDLTYTSESQFTIHPGYGEGRRLSQTESDLTDPVSMDMLDEIENEDEFPSNPVTPSDHSDESFQKTQRREKFLQDTFENLAFSPISKDRFERSLDDLEKQNGGQDLRMSLSARFQSKNPRGIAVQKTDNWYDHMLSELKAYKETFKFQTPKSYQKRKSDMAKAMDETRRQIEMAWKDDSPESEHADSDLSSPCQDQVVNQNFLDRDDDQFKRPRTPNTLRLSWSNFDLPKQPILEEKTPLYKSRSTPSTPIRKSIGKTNLPRCSGNHRSQWRSQIPTPASYSRSITASPAWDKDSETGSETSSSGRSSKSDRRSVRPSTLRIGRSQSSKNLNETQKQTESQNSTHRYMKRTESSRAKITKTASASNLTSSSAKSSEVLNSADVSKPKGSSAKRRTDFAKKKSFYSSSPNLLDLGEQSSMLSNLSNSTPDLLDIDNEPKRYSTGTPKRPPRSSSSSRGEGYTLRTGRLSLPSNPPVESAKSKVTKSDKDLMPPPTSLPNKSKQDLVKKNKQDVFLKRATQAKRQNSNDLTLDQAKSILLGKSGILESKKSQGQSNSSLTEHSSSTTYLSSKDELSDPKIQGVATEIENTVSELRIQKIRDSAAKNSTEFDASPLDLPERDNSPKTVNLNTSKILVVQRSLSSEVEVTDSVSHDSNEDDSVSVRDRIAILNAQSSPRSSESPPRCSSPRTAVLKNSASPALPKYDNISLSKRSVNTANNSPPNSSGIAANNSPPNSSGIGSSLDSDTATKMFSSSDGLSPPEDVTVSDISDSTVCLSENTLDLIDVIKKVKSLELKVKCLEEDGEKKNARIEELENQVKQLLLRDQH